MRVVVPSLLLCVGLFTAAAWGAPAPSISEERIERLFRPRLGERLAMSTDGHYLAYTKHVGTDLHIIVYDLEKLKVKTDIIADDDRPIMFSKEKQRTSLRFLEWANGHRLVFAPTIEVVSPPIEKPSGEILAMMSPEVREMVAAIPQFPPKYIAPVMAVDADGGHPTDLGKKGGFQELIAESIPDGDEKVVVPQLHRFGTGKFRDQLLVEVHAGGAGLPTNLFRLNVETGAHVLVHREFGSGAFLYDWAGEPRLSPITPRRSTKTSFQYHAPGMKKWVTLSGPPDEDAGTYFVRSPENYFGPRVTALGFDFDPNVLFYASNVGRDTFGIFGMDLRTQKRTAFALDVPHRDLVGLDTAIATSPLIFDAFREKLVGVRANFGPRPLTVWLDADLAEIQRAVERRFPQRSVQVQQWNEARTRFIVRTSGGTDPGSIFLVRRPEGSMTELTRAAPWLDEKELHETRFFEFTAPNGAQLTGQLTLPRKLRINPPPLVIWFASGIPPQPHPEFDPQAQVLADMGFVVCRLNQRGVVGFGAEHRDALRLDFDRTPASDAVAALDWVADHQRIDRKRVVLLGEGFGAHLALRASQLNPDVFRCVVAFDPVINFTPLVQAPPNVEVPDVPTFRQRINRLYLEGTGRKVADLPVTAHPDEFNASVFVAMREDQDTVSAAGVADLRRQLRRRDLVCETVEYRADYTHGLPAARARVYRALEEFLNLNLYHYDVKIGPVKVVKE